MRRIALAVAFSTLFAANAARANDGLAGADRAKDPVAVDTATDIVAKDVVAKDDNVAPPVRMEQKSGSLAGISVLRSLHAGLAVAQVYDVYSTQQAISRGAVEMNPLLKRTVGSRAAFITIKAAMTIGPIYEAERLWKNQHRMGAIALMAAANGIMLGVAAHNAAVMNNAVIVR